MACHLYPDESVHEDSAQFLRHGRLVNTVADLIRNYHTPTFAPAHLIFSMSPARLRSG